MGLNTKLNAGIIANYKYDESANADRVTVVNTDISIELDEADGDSVAVRSLISENSLTAVDNTYASAIIAAVDAPGYSTLDLFVKTATTIVGPQVLTVQISPTTAGDVWIDTALTVTPSTTAGVVVKGTALTNVVAQRIRLNTAAAITSGTYDVYLLAKGN